MKFFRGLWDTGRWQMRGKRLGINLLRVTRFSSLRPLGRGTPRQDESKRVARGG
jgi:hypothetical protein